MAENFLAAKTLSATAELRELFEQLAQREDDDDRSQAQQLLSQLHAGDIADFIDRIPPNQRELAWSLLPEAILAAVVNDMDISTATAFVKSMPDEKIAQCLSSAEDLEDAEGIIRCVAPKRRSLLLRLSGLDSNLDLLRSLSYAEDTVGEIMDFVHFKLQADTKISAAAALLRKKGELPSHTDKIFVVDGKKLIGVVPLKYLFIEDTEAKLRDIMVASNLHTLTPEVSINEAVDSFERYDLISMPVLNDNGELIGRVTIDEILYFMTHERHSDLLSSSGIKEEEDIFAPIMVRMRNRCFWIFFNLLAAFLVSLMVGTFEATILELVALAALMPIVGNLAGNAGMQTATLVIRGLALGQVRTSNWYSFLGRELMLGCLNGLIWGILVGLFGLLFYQDFQLAMILTLSMATVFVFGPLVGFIVPVTVNLLHRDPALGTAVVVTTVTDCLAFFVFLGLASLYLV